MKGRKGSKRQIVKPEVTRVENPTGNILAPWLQGLEKEPIRMTALAIWRSVNYQKNIDSKNWQNLHYRARTMIGRDGSDLELVRRPAAFGISVVDVDGDGLIREQVLDKPLRQFGILSHDESLADHGAVDAMIDFVMVAHPQARCLLLQPNHVI